MKRLILIGGGTLLLLGAMLFGALFAIPMPTSAQGTPTPTPTTAANPYCDQYLRSLADRLGVPPGTLRQDSLAAAKDVLAQMVKDGRLTQKQANSVVQYLQDPQVCTGTGLSQMDYLLAVQALHTHKSDITDRVAQGLHLSPAELRSQLQSGKSLSDIASAQHVSNSELRTTVTDAIQSALNNAVRADDLTQQQATSFMQKVRSDPRILDHILKAPYGMDHPDGGSR